jgi:flavocytochrome c
VKEKRIMLTWDKSFDVVVVGAGGAGLAAAIAAAEQERVVLVIEALDSVLKSNTATCGGVMMGAETSVQREAGITDSIVAFEKYLEAVGGGFDDPGLRHLWATTAGETFEWVKDMGVEFPTSHLYISGVEPMFADVTPPVARGHITSTRSGRPIVEALYRRAQELGVTFYFETQGQRLIASNGAVRGIVIQQADTYSRIEARLGVVLATAGFSRNPDLIRNFMPKMMTGGSFGSTWQQGDGIVMGQHVGAQLVNMWVPQAAVFGVPTTPDMTPCMVITIWGQPCVMVGQDGKRHFREDMYYEFLYDHIAELSGGYVWTIWDHTVTESGSNRIVVPPFSDGLVEEVARGWVIKAESVRQLAERLDIAPETLETTLATYNAGVAQNADAFGKTVGLGPVERGPFYAAKTIPAICDTAGGLKVDTQMRVLNVYDEPIPGLYAAGSTTGGWRGKIYPGSGTAVSVAIGFGRIAGQSAAQTV